MLLGNDAGNGSLVSSEMDKKSCLILWNFSGGGIYRFLICLNRSFEKSLHWRLFIKKSWSLEQFFFRTVDLFYLENSFDKSKTIWINENIWLNSNNGKKWNNLTSRTGLTSHIHEIQPPTKMFVNCWRSGLTGRENWECHCAWDRTTYRAGNRRGGSLGQHKHIQAAPLAN